jgi:hypothetical protein
MPCRWSLCLVAALAVSAVACSWPWVHAFQPGVSYCANFYFLPLMLASPKGFLEITGKHRFTWCSEVMMKQKIDRLYYYRYSDIRIKNASEQNLFSVIFFSWHDFISLER